MEADDDTGRSGVRAGTLRSTRRAPGAGRPPRHHRRTELVGVDHRRARVASLLRGDAGWTVSLDDGSTVEAGDVVLATGFPGRPVPPCDAPLDDPRVVANPWTPGVWDRPNVDRVVVIGTGLTMVDVNDRHSYRVPPSSTDTTGALCVLREPSTGRQAISLLRSYDFGWRPIPNHSPGSTDVLLSSEIVSTPFMAARMVSSRNQLNRSPGRVEHRGKDRIRVALRRAGYRATASAAGRALSRRESRLLP